MTALVHFDADFQATENVAYQQVASEANFSNATEIFPDTTAQSSSLHGTIEEELQSVGRSIKLSMQHREGPTHWNQSNEQYFDNLAVKEALGALDENEAEELETLSRLRASILFHQTADGLLEQRKQAQATHNLISALNDFFKTTL